MNDKLIVEQVNKRLLGMGKHLDGRTIFRIVWSTSQLEKRIGNFTDYYGSIIIREVSGVLREVQKYPYCLDRWVLEKLIFLNPSHQSANRELVTRRAYDYEPIFVFQDNDYNPLSVNWPSVDWIINSLTNVRTESIKTEAMFDAEDKAAEEKEIDELALVLEEEGRSNLFAFEESVFLDSTKQPKWELDNEKRI